MVNATVVLTMHDLGRNGRLGNQLFQWAVLRALTLDLKKHTSAAVRLAVPVQDRLSRIFPALQYACVCRHASGRPLPLEPPLSRTEQAHLVRRHYEEPLFCHTPLLPVMQQWLQDACTAEPTAAPCLQVNLRGYYQSFRYFAHHADIIRRDFTFTPAVQTAADAYLHTVRLGRGSLPVVACHVRRGDYTTDKIHSYWIPAASVAQYVRQAMQTVLERLGTNSRVVALVFSDDIAWCREHLVWPGDDEGLHRGRVMVTECTLNDDVVELCVMAKCDHLIISPSTYSWWGAWLNERPNKIVVAPDPWFDPPYATQIQYKQGDLMPEDWVTVSVPLIAAANSADVAHGAHGAHVAEHPPARRVTGGR
jgi:hypothetical protein